MSLHKLSTVSDALSHLDKQQSNFSFFNSNISLENENKQSKQFEITILKVLPITNEALKDYLTERKINIDTAKQHCYEIYYSVADKRYFALGFKNDSGGYALRNKYFKGCTTSDVTTYSNTGINKDSCLVFEGFMDYLSYLIMNNLKKSSNNIVVLNSTSNLSKAIDFIKSYDKVFTYLDNDEGGRKSTQQINQVCKSHIHASIVPIVKGERRQKKSNKENEPTKKQYKKKKTDRPRLCADDVMARDKLTAYQDSYAEAMIKYGLERGIKGSEARHITTAEHFRNQKAESNNLQLDIAQLLQQKESEQKALEDIKSQKNTEKLKKSAIDVGSTIVAGIGSMIGTSKVKMQQQEIDNLKSDNENLSQEIQVLHQRTNAMQKEYSILTEKLKAELDRIYKLFPKIKEFLRIENLCKHLGFSDELTQSILRMKPTGFRGKLYSSEYQRKFETEESVAEVKNHPIEKDKLQFTIDGVSDTNWFRQKQREFLEGMGINIKENERNRGMRR